MVRYEDGVADIAEHAINSTDDILKNPQLLYEKTPYDVEKIIGNTPGWYVETLGKGKHKGQGWMLRQYGGANGEPTGRMIQWHPGGGHHGPHPYWKVSDGKIVTRIGPQF
ncbi:MAG: hypothetical protein DRI57_12600 [Deltaproteobacteria bacterium]|nr:MAG: hypothetical protein DRI57_12600 [Deltaproteobacteria bacterium]